MFRGLRPVFFVLFLAAQFAAERAAAKAAMAATQFMTGPWGTRPLIGSCSQESIEARIFSVRRNIQRLQNGEYAEGRGVGGSVFRHNDCDQESGWCTPLPENPKRFDPYLSEEIADTCLVFCVRVHEWWHFVDDRPWSLKWTNEELSAFWELPAYRAEAQCLETFFIDNPRPYSTPAGQTPLGRPVRQVLDTPAFNQLRQSLPVSP